VEYDTPAVIEFTDVSKTFLTKGREVHTFANLNLAIRRNEFTTIIGPSGCGKTTLLKLCAGLIYPSSGRVIYKGHPVSSINTDVGFVTQDSNLFPWLTLMENVEFPLVIRGVPKNEREKRAAEFLAIYGLEGFESHYPHELSGGMQKRASIIRTMIYGPNVILMDEPFGPLDAQTRLNLQQELSNIWSKEKKTIVFVTHDLVEAISLSDNVVLLTPRPASIREIFPITLIRPRNIYQIHIQEGFADVYQKIWGHFGDEFRRDRG
jgi:NitT/TauT family transport system ATP-binding protein